MSWCLNDVEGLGRYRVGEECFRENVKYRGSGGVLLGYVRSRKKNSVVRFVDWERVLNFIIRGSGKFLEGLGLGKWFV